MISKNLFNMASNVVVSTFLLHLCYMEVYTLTLLEDVVWCLRLSCIVVLTCILLRFFKDFILEHYSEDGNADLMDLRQVRPHLAHCQPGGSSTIPPTTALFQFQ